MYFFSKNKEIKKPMFKKRYIHFKNYLKSKNSIFFKNINYVELNFFKLFLFRLKRVYKKKKIKMFINLNRNHLITKKPKNSRMGKGKGKFTRFIYKITPYKPVIILPNISVNRMTSLKGYLLQSKNIIQH